MAASGPLDVPSEAGPGSAANAARGAEPRSGCTHLEARPYGFPFCPWCGASTNEGSGGRAVPSSSPGSDTQGGSSRLEPAACGSAAGPGSPGYACAGLGCFRLCELCTWRHVFPSCEDGRKALEDHLELAHEIRTVQLDSRNSE